MGTADFAIAPLRALATAHDVVGVYSKAPSASRRGGALHPSPVAEVAAELGVPVFTPATLREASAVSQLRALEPDVVVVAAYGLILTPEVLEIPRYTTVNVHGSLLPRWRGAAPIERAILAGEHETGACIMRVEEGLDTGPTCACAAVEITSQTRDELVDQLSSIGADLLLASLDEIERGDVRWSAQNEALATYAHKVDKSEFTLHPTLMRHEASVRVRAASAHAPARLAVAGISLGVLQLVDDEADARAAGSRPALGPGRAAAEPGGLRVGLSDGTLLVTELQPAGKRAMGAAEWLRGARLPEGVTWE